MKEQILRHDTTFACAPPPWHHTTKRGEFSDQTPPTRALPGLYEDTSGEGRLRELNIPAFPAMRPVRRQAVSTAIKAKQPAVRQAALLSASAKKQGVWFLIDYFYCGSVGNNFCGALHDL